MAHRRSFSALKTTTVCTENNKTDKNNWQNEGY